ncbi:MAG: polysaccharide biosynthesis/export family protein [Bacteroidota bacterium]|jgi:polysaccharide export outer membrane protein
MNKKLNFKFITAGKALKLSFILFALFALPSCKISNFLRPNIMLKTPSKYNFNNFDSTLTSEFKVSAGDVLQISISPNDGFNRINFNADNRDDSRAFTNCVVDNNGNVKLPLVGIVNVEGKTLRGLEKDVEEIYKNYYVKPFVTITTSSKRFVIFQGGATSKSVKIEDDNLTLFEALALGGGVVNDGKAYNIKLIRVVNGKTCVYKIDLSTIEGLSMGQKRVLPNDVIYIEPRLRLVSRALGEITTILSIVTTTLLAINLFRQ